MWTLESKPVALNVLKVSWMEKIGTWDLEDAAWAVRVVDEEGVGGIIHNDAAVLLGELDQLGQLLPGGRRAGGVVGRAEEDEVRAPDLQNAKF